MHSYRGVAIVATHNTEQAKSIPGHTAESINIQAARGLMASVSASADDIDGVCGIHSKDIAYALGLGTVWTCETRASIRAVLECAAAIQQGLCSVALISGGGAGNNASEQLAPWTRPDNEFSAPFGMYTAAQYALMARQHMDRFGSSTRDFAEVAAIIRNNGHVNPQAVFHGRGPYTADDVLASPMIAEPFHRLDCAVTNDGGSAVMIASAERAADFTDRPVHLLGAGVDQIGPGYRHALPWDAAVGDTDIPAGFIGRRAARRAFAQAGLRPDDVDCLELYDPFSFEVLRQLEAFDFCGDGEGAAFVADGRIAPGGSHPVDTDGGLLSFSHSGTAQLLQRVVRATEQLQGTCASRQLDDVHVAMCSNGGSASMFSDVLLLGKVAA